MKGITAKVITISSQILVVCLFVLLLVNSNTKTDESLVVYNNNFDKMAERTLNLFENQFTMEQTVSDDCVVELNDEIEVDDYEDNLSIENDDISSVENTIIYDIKEEVTESEIVVEDGESTTLLEEVIETHTGILTGYGPDCVGCGNFNTGKVSTSTGYHIANIVNGAIEPAFTITYNDHEYGEVRIVAADDDIPFYSIVRITVPGWDSPVTAIVLDRGSTVGFDNCRSNRGCLTNFDLLYTSEAESLGKTQNVKFEILRNGK